MSLFRVAQTADSGFSVIANKRSRGSNPAPEIETGIVCPPYWLRAPAFAKPLRCLQDEEAVAEKVTSTMPDRPKNPTYGAGIFPRSTGTGAGESGVP